MPEPWGHKVTLVAYVPGGEHIAEMVARVLANAADREWVDFVGVRIDEVTEEPIDQVAS